MGRGLSRLRIEQLNQFRSTIRAAIPLSIMGNGPFWAPPLTLKVLMTLSIWVMRAWKAKVGHTEEWVINALKPPMWNQVNHSLESHQMLKVWILKHQDAPISLSSAQAVKRRKASKIQATSQNKIHLNLILHLKHQAPLEPCIPPLFHENWTWLTRNSRMQTKLWNYWQMLKISN